MLSQAVPIVRFIALGIALSTLLTTQSPAQGNWVTKTPMPTPRGGPAVGVIGGKIYVSGVHDAVPGPGFNVVSSLVVYDPVTDTWDSSRTPDPQPRGGHGAAVIGGKLYVAGGCPGSPPFGPACASTTSLLESYDPVTDTWTTLAPMPLNRGAVAVAAVDGKLYVAGGFSTCTSFCPQTGDLQVYDPVTNTWTIKAPMQARDDAEAVGIGGKLYVLGGLIRAHPGPGGGAATGSLQVYDPASDIWDASKMPMPTARTSFAGDVINNQILAVGGSDNVSAVLAANERYDPATDTWTSLAPMPTVRAQLGAAAVGGKLYVFGGASTTILDVLEVFSPNSAPSALCGSVTVAANASCLADASIDAGSSDPDGDPVTLSQAPAGPYSLGATSVTLTATDPSGASSSCTATVSVEDQTPPAITASLDPVSEGDESGDSDEGRFMVAFGAADNCALTSPTTALLKAPGCAPVPVINGQVVEFEVEDEGSCELEVENGIIEIEAASLTLEVTAEDATGLATVSVDAALPGADNDEAWEVDDD